jgi:hypothetical protein
MIQINCDIFGRKEWCLYGACFYISVNNNTAISTKSGQFNTRVLRM